jgi:hypothetical protein
MPVCGFKVCFKYSLSSPFINCPNERWTNQGITSLNLSYQEKCFGIFVGFLFAISKKYFHAKSLFAEKAKLTKLLNYLLSTIKEVTKRSLPLISYTIGRCNQLFDSQDVYEFFDTNELHGGSFFMHVKTKYRNVILGVLILLCISQLLMPVSNCNQDDTLSDQEFWLSRANGAWRFFEPGQALNTQTGLHSASLDWPYFTEWDLGTYIQTMLDARKLGILQNSGQSGFDNRIGKIIEFL